MAGLRLRGDYTVVRHGAPVAVCTLNGSLLAKEIATRRPAGLAIVGTLHTENLWYRARRPERPHQPEPPVPRPRGEDTRQAIGHLPGQSLAALCENGTDGEGRNPGRPRQAAYPKERHAGGGRSVPSSGGAHWAVGKDDLASIAREVESCAARTPGVFDGAPTSVAIPVLPAHEPAQLVLDPAGFLVVYPDRSRGLVLEHYRKEGVLDLVIQGATASAVGATAIERGVLSRLDHAVYLGRELARAEESLRTGVPYVQDRAPGALSVEEEQENCGCNGSTCTPAGGRSASPRSEK